MSPSGKASHEDVLESPLPELGLVKPVGKRDGFRFVRGNKPSLGEWRLLLCHYGFLVTLFRRTNALL